MSPLEITALLRRHLIAVAVICVFAAGATYRLTHADPGYQDSGTVAFTAPKAANDMFAYDYDLLVVGELMNWYMGSPAAEQQVHAAGGSGHYDVAMVNLNNQEFPYYKFPYLNITVSSPSSESTQSTFTAAVNVLMKNLAARQASQGVPPKKRITALLASQQPGPVSQRGSIKRSLIAITILTIIVAIMIASFLDRRKQRSGPISPRERHSRSSASV